MLPHKPDKDKKFGGSLVLNLDNDDVMSKQSIVIIVPSMV